MVSLSQKLSLTVLIVAVLVATASAAEKGREPTVPAKTKTVEVRKELLCRHWLHSYEEKKPGPGQLFRPAGFKKFGPSRFRMQYKFQKNGDCEWYWLAPDDGHKWKKGKWSLDSKDPSILQIHKEKSDLGPIVESARTESFRILELSKNQLRLATVVCDKK